MRRVSLLLVVLMSTCFFVAGCGGEGKKSTPAEEKKVLEQSQTNMQKGMDAMKTMKGGSK